MKQFAKLFVNIPLKKMAHIMYLKVLKLKNTNKKLLFDRI